MEKMHKHYRWPPRTTRNVVTVLNDRSYYNIEQLVKHRMKAAPQFVQNLDVESKLEGHNGCVNCLEWSANGQLLASGSDDNRLILWKPFHRKIALDLMTPHSGNIFSVKFLPNTGDSLIATAAADRCCYVFDINRATDLSTPCWKCCNCHRQRVKRLATVPECPCTFWSAGEDGRILQFDIREPHHCNNEKVCLIDLQNHLGASAEAKCIAVNPRRPEQLAVGASDAYARIYDRRMIKLCRLGDISLGQNDHQIEDNLTRDCVTYYCPGHLNKVKDRKMGFTTKTITYVAFSPDGCELLVNMGSEQIYLYDMNNVKEPVYLSMPQFNKPVESDENDSSDRPIDSSEEACPNELPSTSAKSIPPSMPITYTKLTKLPKHIDEMKRSGNDFMENEKYLQAITQYSECIKLLPNHPVFYLNRATAYMRRNWFGDVYAGLRDCQQALQLDPSYVKAHFRLARALFELGFVMEADECLDELKKRFPNEVNNKQIKLLSQDIESHKEQHRFANRDSDSPNTELSANEMHWRTCAKDFSERFVGHCNTTTDIKEANFFGGDGSFIVAGSDEGNFYVWERPTTKIVAVYKGDSTIVNCVQPHPSLCLLATSGIDHEIRLWSPKSDEYNSENRISYYDTTVVNNQQRMQSDPFEFNASGAVCRAS